MRAVILLIGWLLLWGLAQAQPPEAPISGTVTTKATATPLAGVRIEVEASGVIKSLPHPTDASGRFALDPADLFTPPQLDTDVLHVHVTKEGFHHETRVKRFPQRGRFHWTAITIQLEPLAGSSSLSPSEENALTQHISTSGHTLYMLPYALEFPTGGPDAAQVNKRLKWHLKRGIVTHLQSLALSEPFQDISLKLLPLPVDVTNTERLRTYGAYLNALGMIGGLGNLEHDATGQSILRVSSEYLIIPSMAALPTGSLYVDDALPADRINSFELFRHLSTLWGQHTVLAMSIREFRRAQAANDRAGLQRVRDHLLAERAQTGPGSEPFVRHLNAMLQLVERELQP